MKDTVIKGNGKSRVITAPSDMPSTFDAWRTQLLAGEAYLDIALNTATTGDNIGCDVIGTAQNKNNLLDDTTKTALELSQTDPTVNNALYALSQKTQPAELHVLAGSGIVVTATFGTKTLTATAGSDGWAILYPAAFGDWTLSATIGGSTVTQTFTIDAIAVFYTALASLESLSWSVVASVSEAGLASMLWNVGDTKTLTVNSVTYTAVILGFDHDTKTAGGKAGITFQLQNCLATTYPMNSTDTNSGGWTSSVMRGTTMATLLSQLPSTLQSAIKQVNKLTSAGNQSSTINTTADKLFLLSEIEVFGAVTYSKAGEGTQYDYYKAGNSKIKTVNGSANYWWERSPYGSATAYFCCVSSSGSADYGTAGYSGGVSFGFCV